MQITYVDTLKSNKYADFGKVRNTVTTQCLTGHTVAYWLRRYVTNQRVAGSRPNEVNDFYQFT
jgi:hypothetical protein